MELPIVTLVFNLAELRSPRSRFNGSSSDQPKHVNVTIQGRQDDYSSPDCKILRFSLCRPDCWSSLDVRFPMTMGCVVPTQLFNTLAAMVNTRFNRPRYSCTTPNRTGHQCWGYDPGHALLACTGSCSWSSVAVRAWTTPITPGITLCVFMCVHTHECKRGALSALPVWALSTRRATTVVDREATMIAIAAWSAASF